MHETNLARLDLNLFVVFEAIYREGSISRAARQLNLTQPAVSHALARLRERLDDALFVRRGNQMVPTARARALVAGRRSARARLLVTAYDALSEPDYTDADAEAEMERVARGLLSEARGGLKLLELVATIAPLLGLLGTVIGMISAFQALQEAGSRADPSMLAGGIWEALLTTAAGMAVAIPATMALSWLESVCEKLALDFEDIGTRVFLGRGTAEPHLRAAAE